MTKISIYDIDASRLEDIAIKLDTTIAEVIDMLIDNSNLENE